MAEKPVAKEAKKVVPTPSDAELEKKRIEKNKAGGFLRILKNK